VISYYLSEEEEEEEEEFIFHNINIPKFQQEAALSMII